MHDRKGLSEEEDFDFIMATGTLYGGGADTVCCAYLYMRAQT
jgi:hypothetical protein